MSLNVLQELNPIEECVACYVESFEFDSRRTARFLFPPPCIPLLMYVAVVSPVNRRMWPHLNKSKENYMPQNYVAVGAIGLSSKLTVPLDIVLHLYQPVRGQESSRLPLQRTSPARA